MLTHTKSSRTKKINDNELYFYTKSKKQGVYNLLRHFRNCASHRNAIVKVKRNGKWFYQFEDKGLTYGKPYISMRGNISKDLWSSYIDEINTIVDNILT